MMNKTYQIDTRVFLKIAVEAEDEDDARNQAEHICGELTFDSSYDYLELESEGHQIDVIYSDDE